MDALAHDIDRTVIGIVRIVAVDLIITVDILIHAMLIGKLLNRTLQGRPDIDVINFDLACIVWVVKSPNAIRTESDFAISSNSPLIFMV